MVSGFAFVFVNPPSQVMQTSERQISGLDHIRLMSLLQDDLEKSVVPPRSLHRLYLLLNSVQRCRPEDIREDTVTMNSDIMIRHSRSGQKEIIRIIYPADCSSTDNLDDKVRYLEIYDPTAMGILGRKVNEICRVSGDGGEEPVVIEKVLFQPEAHRLYNL